MAVDAGRRSASAGSAQKKLSLLTALAFQSSALILIMHYSRTMPPVNGHRYYASTAVFLNEVLKLVFSLTMALYEIATKSHNPQSSTAAGIFGELAGAVFTGDGWKLAVPAMLYTLQNSLQYIAVGNLDAATYQVTSQLKIMTTAIFSVVLLGRTLSMQKWMSLVLLMVGVAVVSASIGYAEDPVLSMKDLKDGVAFHSPRNIWDLKALGNVAAGQLSKRSATYEGIDEDFAEQHPRVNASIGFGALILACALSGLAGVYFEKILKDPKGNANTASLWVRNVQLSFYSLWPAFFLGVLFKDGEHIAKTGFFAGYNWVVWTAIVAQAIGGMIVALVIKHSNNIAKNFATSFSVITSFLASVVLFDFEITFLYGAGTAIVLVATYLYSSDEAGKLTSLRPPPINVSQYEKRDEPSYFDLESVASAARSPMRGDALSTSRPGTPAYERSHFRQKSSENLRESKRSA